ncbi:MAG: hypothetical protein HYS39_03620, partial [Proteobacteria bacterium]|nr:hypothetical protein [Pseudomonadota bacterium]
MEFGIAKNHNWNYSWIVGKYALFCISSININAHTKNKLVNANDVSLICNRNIGGRWIYHLLLSLLILIVTYTFAITNSYAIQITDFYTGCVKGFELTDESGAEVFPMSPAGTDCYIGCLEECQKISSSNADVITACMPVCQNGKSFVTFLTQGGRVKSHFGIPIQKRKSNASVVESKIVKACINKVTEYVTNSIMQEGNLVTITLATPQESDFAQNKIYPCGMKKITLVPLVPDIEKVTSTTTG